MKRLIFIFITLIIYNFFTPDKAAAGSCKCLDTNITDTSAQIYDCTVKSGATSQPACEMNNGIIQASRISDCVYYNEDNCNGAPITDGYTRQENASCTTVDDCISKSREIGKSLCVNKVCWFDKAALQVFLTGAVNAFGNDIVIPQKKPILEISIPGVSFSDPKNNVDSEGFVHVPYLAEYLTQIYRISIIFASLIAVIIIILNGFRITVSGGGEGRSVGMQNIGKAITGLFILWGSYTLFYTINPELVQFQALKIKYQKTIIIPEPDTETPSEAIPTAAPSDIVSIPQTSLINSNGFKALKPAVAALEKAITEFNSGVDITSAYRAPDTQYRLMKEMCGCKPENELPADVASKDWGNYCTACSGCQASCSISRLNGVFQGLNVGHLAGNAFDIYSKEGSNIACNNTDENINLSKDALLTKKTTASGATCVPRKQQELIKAMINNGFCVGLSAASKSLRESWHFEYKGSNLKVSGFCTSDLSDPILKTLYYLQN